MMFMLSNSFGMIFLGNLGDKMNLKNFISYGTISASLCLIAISICGALDLLNRFDLLLLMTLNGLF